jgi:hypothetical protein
MAVFCPGCSRENVEGSRFCQSCGTTIPAPPAATQQPAYVPPATYPQAQPSYQQPYQQPAYQQPYPPAAYAPGMVAAAGPRKGTAFYVGAVIILLCGILILISSFLAWDGVSGYKMESGWDIMKSMTHANMNAFANTADVGTGGSKLIFSGLCTVIAGGAIILFGLLVLLTRSKGLAGLLLFLAIVSLAMAGINTYSFLSIEGLSIGAGMIMLLIGSIGGLIGSIVCLSG